MLAELQNVSKYYGQPNTDNRNLVLDKVSLAIGERDSIAIAGPSGSGKSTLLNILGTLDHPSSGEVMLDGIRVESMSEQQLAHYRNQFVGFVFQLHYLLPQLTLIENVLLPTLPLKDRGLQSAAVARAHHLIEKVGLKKQIHQRPGQMSVGECQRAAVVRALINQPRLLLADEPTGSLDAGNAMQLGQLLAELNVDPGLAVVVVTHSMDLASLMKKIFKLSSGQLHHTSQV
jgi:lipoprotein-releasing system ATP-binding protein